MLGHSSQPWQLHSGGRCGEHIVGGSQGTPNHHRVAEFQCVCPAEVANPGSIQAAAAKIGEHLRDSGLNLLINNAGMVKSKMLDAETLEDMTETYTTNTAGPLLMGQVSPQHSSRTIPNHVLKLDIVEGVKGQWKGFLSLLWCPDGLSVDEFYSHVLELRNCRLAGWGSGRRGRMTQCWCQCCPL